MTLSLLARIGSELDKVRIPYALIGAAALAVHGVSRSTLDQDLLTTDLRVLAPDIWHSLQDVSVDIRRGDAEDPLAGVIRFTAPGQRDVDIVVGRHHWQSAALGRATRVSVGKMAIPVVGLGDLILLKLYAGGAQDLWDVEQLLAVGGSRQVTDEVERGLTELPSRCADLWARRQNN
jgi:hypothetical protein